MIWNDKKAMNLYWRWKLNYNESKNLTIDKWKENKNKKML